jgi:hypothetical protein
MLDLHHYENRNKNGDESSPCKSANLLKLSHTSSNANQDHAYKGEPDGTSTTIRKSIESNGNTQNTRSSGKNVAMA